MYSKSHKAKQRISTGALFVVGMLVASGLAAADAGLDDTGDREVSLDGLLPGDGGFTFEGSTYFVNLSWQGLLRLPGENLIEGALRVDGHESILSQRLDVEAWLAGTLGPGHLFLVDATTGEWDGVPWLRLHYSPVPMGIILPEASGFIEFHFRDDHILHHYSFRLPNAVAAPMQRSQTILEWSPPFGEHGAIDAEGVVHPGDDGSVLDQYGSWQERHRYATYQQTGDSLVAHARILQGDMLNFFSSGLFRVDQEASRAESSFNGITGVDAISGEVLWAVDALLIPAPGAPLVDETVMMLQGISVPWKIALSPPSAGYKEHPVVVATPDSGINPYHEFFYRPDLTDHPCTYIQDFPCDIPALELSIGMYTTYQEAYEADKELWEAVSPGDWFWIPRTVFVAVHCEAPFVDGIFTSEHCILDDDGHGTAVASNILTENPGALIVAKEGTHSIAPFIARGIPVDIYSVSWANSVTIPGHAEILCVNHEDAPIYVTGAGNLPFSTASDCWASGPRVITVGGAYAEGGSEEALAAKQADFVGYFCRPGASPDSTHTWEENCGTSFSGPTVAGALSKVVQAVRMDSGYRGGLQGDYVDPIAGVTVADLRDAMNRTASYDPESQYDNSQITGVPLNPVAPWLQWGWGFYDGLVADATIDHLLGEPAPPKPEGAVFYMEAVHAVKRLQHEPFWDWLIKQDDAGSGGDAPDWPTPMIWIESGVVYEGFLGGLYAGDAEDYYAFWGEQGDVVKARARGVMAAFSITDSNGDALGGTTSMVAWDVLYPDGDETGILSAAPLKEVTLEYTGIHYFQISSIAPQHYGFAIGINEDAPEPGFLGHPLPPVPLGP